MANCVLCGKKMGLFDQVDIDFHGTRQSLCGACYARWKNTHGLEREELERQMLDSPDLMARERVRANVDTGKACPDCGAVLECRLRNFSIGADGYGGLSSMGLPRYMVDLYACPRCGRVVLYTAEDHRQSEQRETEEVVCPECGTRHSPRINCPTCAARDPGKFIPRGGSRGNKPPWEK